MKGVNVHAVGIGANKLQQAPAHGHHARIGIGEAQNIMRLYLRIA